MKSMTYANHVSLQMRVIFLAVDVFLKYLMIIHIQWFISNQKEEKMVRSMIKK